MGGGETALSKAIFPIQTILSMVGLRREIHEENSIAAKIQISSNSFIDFFKILLIYSWETQRGRDIGRGKSRHPTGSLMRDSIPGPQDQDPRIRSAKGRCSTTEPPRHSKASPFLFLSPIHLQRPCSNPTSTRGPCFPHLNHPFTIFKKLTHLFFLYAATFSFTQMISFWT